MWLRQTGSPDGIISLVEEQTKGRRLTGSKTSSPTKNSGPGKIATRRLRALPYQKHVGIQLHQTDWRVLTVCRAGR